MYIGDCISKIGIFFYTYKNNSKTFEKYFGWFKIVTSFTILSKTTFTITIFPRSYAIETYF